MRQNAPPSTLGAHMALEVSNLVHYLAAEDQDGADVVDDTDAEPWPPEAQPDHQPDTAGKRIRYDTKGFPHLIDGEMDQPIRWTDTH